MGDGTEDDRETPKAICDGVKFVSIAVYSNSSYAIDADGNLWAWGDNNYGQLGLGDKEKRLIPEKVTFDKEIVGISAYYNMACAVDIDGKLYIWGQPAGFAFARLTGVSDGNRYTRPITINTDVHFSKVALRESAVIGIDADGGLWENTSGKNFTKLCDGIGFKDASTVGSAASNCSFALDVDGSLYVWGKIDKGIFSGLNGIISGDYEIVQTPTQIDAGIKYECISKTAYAAVRSDGAAVVWRNGKAEVFEPENTFAYIYVSGTCIFAVDTEGNIFARGNYKNYLFMSIDMLLKSYPIVNIVLGD